MENEKTFKTKTGFCHILPDKIVLTRDGVIGDIAKVTVGNHILRILLLYGVLSLGLLYFAFDAYRNGHIIPMFCFGLLGFYFAYGVVASTNCSTTPIIERQKIKGIKFKKAIKYVTRSRFEVYFEDERGKIKKRLILPPGSLTDGKNATEKALKIMIGEKLIEPLPL